MTTPRTRMIDRVSNIAMALIWGTMFLLSFPVVWMLSIYEWLKDRKQEREWDRKYGGPEQ